jgi:hypothetical protein
MFQNFAILAPYVFKIALLAPHLHSLLQMINFDQVNADVASHLNDSAATSVFYLIIKKN